MPIHPMAVVQPALLTAILSTYYNYGISLIGDSQTITKVEVGVTAFYTAATTQHLVAVSSGFMGWGNNVEC